MRSQWCKAHETGLPWWSSGYECTCQCQGRGFDAWSGTIPQATGQMNLCTTLPRPPALEPVSYCRRGHCTAKPTRCNQRKPVHKNKETAQPKKTCTEQVLSVAHNMHSVLSLESSPVENSSELHTSRDLLRDLRRYRLDAYCCSGMRNCHPHLHSLPRTELTHHGQLAASTDPRNKRWPATTNSSFSQTILFSLFTCCSFIGKRFFKTTSQPRSKHPISYRVILCAGISNMQLTHLANYVRHNCLEVNSAMGRAESFLKGFEWQILFCRKEICFRN